MTLGLVHGNRVPHHRLIFGTEPIRAIVSLSEVAILLFLAEHERDGVEHLQTGAWACQVVDMGPLRAGHTQEGVAIPEFARRSRTVRNAHGLTVPSKQNQTIELGVVA